MRGGAAVVAAVLVVLATLASLQSSASAQSRAVADGARRVAAADFEGAITILAQALRSETMSRNDAELALDRIAAAQLAINDEPGLARTLGQLALVAPRHHFGPDVPATLGERLVDVVRRTPPLRVRIVAVSTSPTGAAMRAEVSTDRWSAVRDVELACTWHDGEDSTVARVPRLSVPSSATCTAIARGPGGIPLARVRRDGERIAGDGASTRDADGGIGTGWIVAGIGGAALVVGVAIAVGVAAASGGDDASIRLRGPDVSGW